MFSAVKGDVKWRQYRVGAIDRTESCDIYCGKLKFKKLLLVPEA